MTAPDNSGWQPDPTRPPAHSWQPDGQGWRPDPSRPATPDWQPRHAAPGEHQVPLMPPPPVRRSHRGRVLLASAAAVAVAAGGVTTYVAVSAASSDPSSSARQAVQRLATDLGHSDLVGVLNDLPPNERTAVAGPFLATVKELQRNRVVSAGADLHKVGGLSFSARHLTFAARTQSIGQHVQVVEVTGGTLQVSADVAKLPLTAAFFKAASDGAPPGNATRTLDIGREVRASGKPLRVAVQQVGRAWYPSLSYTIADYATTEAGLPAPTVAQRVPDVGESSADDAVSTMLTSLLRGDVRRAIELVSPDELPVLHDYGTLIASKTHYAAAPVRITNIRFDDTPATGGTDVGIRSLEVSGPGTKVAVDLTGTCPTVTISGHTERLCAAALLEQFGGFGLQLTAAQQRAFTDLFAGLADQRFRTSLIDGRWYVDPVQTYARQLPRMLSHLRGDDLLQLIAFGREH